ncbi:MAG TPA: hypothetical protein VM487_09430 [Phycisphaerae bacterium]|nr:hypothetical protein [Phycisphaerae bacterium]
MKASRLAIFAIALTLGSAIEIARGDILGTAFTYQGQLKDSGVPANGDYDFVFRLFDDPNNGAQVGGDVEIDEWPVSDGLFTVELDFGTDVFTGDALWLDVSVRLDGGGEYTVLSPRQPLNATPYALYALSGPGSGGYWTANGNDIYNTNSGNVGIGTTTPQGQLEVLTADEHAIWVTTNYIPVLAYRESTSGTWPAIHGECDSGHADGSAIRGIMTSTSPGMHSAGVRGINNGTGGEGIGVYGSQDGGGWGVLGTTPDGIGVQGSSDEGYGVFGASGGAGGIGVYGFAVGAESTGVFGISLGEDGYAGYFNGRGCFMGDVGIRVQDPQASLDVLNRSGPPAIRGVSSGTGVYGLHDESSGTLPGVWGATDSVSSNATGVRGFVNSTAPGGSSAGVRGHNNGTGGSGIGVWGSQDGSGYGVYGYTPSGRGVYGLSTDGVGVYGRSTNGYAGYFNGTVSVDVLEITGADVAEKFPVSEEVKPGMVVAIDADNPGQLCLARGAYNRRVAGVVSGAGNIPTGTILGNLPGCEDDPPIALSGRVWVYGDATEQPIVPGDLLTTAAHPGHAMKVTDYEKAQGAVLGKAMTGLEEGTGLVLVLVNLQ